MTRILHLIRAADYAALPPGAPWRPPSLDQEGFIHCTREPEVMRQVANAFYRDDPAEYLVLEVETELVTAPVKFEAPAHPRPGEAAKVPAVSFPHIYGPLNREAIVAVRPARRASDGTFLSL